MKSKDLTPEIAKAAIIGYKGQIEHLKKEIAYLEGYVAGSTSAPATTPAVAPQPRRKMSDAGRKAIADAQKKRWAAFKKEKKAAKAGVLHQIDGHKRSAATRKKMAIAQRKRWAKARKQA